MRWIPKFDLMFVALIVGPFLMATAFCYLVYEFHHSIKVLHGDVLDIAAKGQTWESELFNIRKHAEKVAALADSHLTRQDQDTFEILQKQSEIIAQQEKIIKRQEELWAIVQGKKLSELMSKRLDQNSFSTEGYGLSNAFSAELRIP